MAILAWIDRKVQEIYRVTHLTGVQGQRTSSQVTSGVSLRYQYQQMTSVLNKKSENITEAEFAIIRFWLMWQIKTELFAEIEIVRSTEYSIDDLSIELENMILSMKNVASDHFRVRTQQRIASKNLPEMTDDDRMTINEEIEAAKGVLPVENDGTESRQQLRSTR
jgi:hypothetical protein